MNCNFVAHHNRTKMQTSAKVSDAAEFLLSTLVQYAEIMADIQLRTCEADRDLYQQQNRTVCYK